MNVQGQIKEYITSQPEPKRSDIQELHRIILEYKNKLSSDSSSKEILV